MTTDPTNLLRMLEPAVRPDGQGARVSGAARRGAETAPFEARTFDQLLQAAGRDTPAEANGTDGRAAAASRSLATLGGMNHIENASLRQQLEQRLAATPGPTSHPALTTDPTD